MFTGGRGIHPLGRISTEKKAVAFFLAGAGERKELLGGGGGGVSERAERTTRRESTGTTGTLVLRVKFITTISLFRQRICF